MSTYPADRPGHPGPQNHPGVQRCQPPGAETGPPGPGIPAGKGPEGQKGDRVWGSFYRYEGLDLLVTAFAKIAATHDNARLLQNPWKPWPWKKPWWQATWAATRN